MTTKHGTWSKSSCFFNKSSCIFKRLNGQLSNFFSGDELLRVEQLTVRARTDLIHDRRLQIHLPMKIVLLHFTVVARAQNKILPMSAQVTITHRGTCLPAPVSLKKVLKASLHSGILFGVI